MRLRAPFTKRGAALGTLLALAFTAVAPARAVDAPAQLLALQDQEPPAQPSPAAPPPPAPGAPAAPPSAPPAPPGAEPGAPLPPSENVAPPPAAVEPTPAGIPPATTDTAPLADGASTTSDAELEALSAELSALGASEVTSHEPQFTLYGFADFWYLTQVGKKTPILDPQDASFMVGNFNVYLSTEISSRWRSLAEVRFMYVPHGTVPDPILQPTLPQVRADTSAPDPADFDRPLRWGGIEIERLWLEYMADSWLTIRAGQWLTPYGVWNVDHGSPTVIAITRPYIIGEALFPERQTGIELYGHLFLDDTQLGYHLTLSNGRGPIDAYRDLDGNKAVGGRLFVRNTSSLGTLTIGVSGYRGAFTDRAVPVIGVENGALVYSAPITQRYDELALAADVKWEWGGLLVQGEGIISDLRYDDALRPPNTLPSAAPPSVFPDMRRKGLYVLAGYRTPWWNVMPYAVLVAYDNPAFGSPTEYTLGLNIRPLPQVTLKTEYRYVDVPVVSGGPRIRDINLLAFQAAWSF